MRRKPKTAAVIKLTVSVPAESHRRIRGFQIATGIPLGQLLAEAIALRTAGFRVCLPAGSSPVPAEPADRPTGTDPSLRVVGESFAGTANDSPGMDRGDDLRGGPIGDTRKILG